MITELRRRFGYQCVGIKVNCSKDMAYSPVKPIRFCEAVNDAFKTPLIFNPQNLVCFGARRSMGFLHNDKELIRHISGESGISNQTVKKALFEIPTMNTPIHNIFMGIEEEVEKEIQPDMYIMYINPSDLIELIRSYALKINDYPTVKPYMFLSVCGNVFISTFKSARMSVSFGCPESRKYGGVKDNQLVVGLPYSDAVQLFG
ncbi:MAG: DUF169 domain-containing protein [Bacteroidales bacterium]